MKHTVYWIAGLVLLTAPIGAAHAQERQTVRGRVLDATTGSGLARAVVRDPSQSGRSVVTDQSGSFTIVVTEATKTLTATRGGFTAETLRISSTRASLEFLLSPIVLAIDPLLVSADRTFSAASAGSLREIDFKIRPRQSSQDLLRLVPGLVIAQHAGGGKAEQIFLRGFDADHGTDVAISVDGTPINTVSHGHGQGYADLHFLLPEAVERIVIRKGPYDSRDGDFATAGAVGLQTKDRIDASEVKVEAGSFDNHRVFLAMPFGGDRLGSGGWAGVSIQQTRGPFVVAQDHRRLNVFGKYTAPVADGAEVVLSATAFSARWNQSGQIPERALRAGTVQRFGSIDESEGGHTERYEVALGLRSKSAAADKWDARAYLTRYDFELFSNFTFFLNDSINGDAIGQTDQRYTTGLAANYSKQLGGSDATRLSAGAGSRTDFAEVDLYKQRERIALEPLARSDVFQNNLYTFVQLESEIAPRLRMQAGLRADALNFHVTDQLAAADSESAWRAIASPKLNLAFQAAPSATLFANFGSGFHSNDARLIGRAADGSALARALGAELGGRATVKGATFAVAAWLLDLESELVYVGDEGVVEPSGATRRLGLDFEGRLQLVKRLWADLDVNLTRGRFVDEPRGQNFIPLAPSLTSSGGLVFREPGKIEAGLRYRLIGSRPANEDGSVTARGDVLWQTFAHWTHRQLTLFVTIENVLNVEWNEAQFDTTSRLRHEAQAVSELHLTPGAPRSIGLGLRYEF